MGTRTKAVGIVLVGVLLCAASGIGGVAWATHNFNDVPDGSFFGPAINAGAEAGCFTGFGDGSFQPGSNPNRGQFAFWTNNCGGRAGQEFTTSATPINGGGEVILEEITVEVEGSGMQYVHLVGSSLLTSNATIDATCTGGVGSCL
ncbi:MAG: S-layer homology domain-containing protein, partial [Actinomycetota bacterium]